MNNLMKLGHTWKISIISKILLTAAINLISSKDTDDECVMHSKSDNIKIMNYDKADEVMKELFDSLLQRYQVGLETSIKGSDFMFDCAYLLYYKCHKINPNRGRSYTDFADWIKNKKATTINLVNDGDKYF